MERQREWLAASAVCACGLLLGFVGCGDTQRDGGNRSPTAAIGSGKQADGQKPEGDGSPLPKLMADWPKDKFAGALILSGEMIGYHEPCGCTAEQKGGLVRRAVLVDLLRKQGWDVGLLDLGTLSQDPLKSRDGPEQTRLKFAMTIKALQSLGYAGLALSADDLRLGTAETLMEFENSVGEGKGPVAILSANGVPTAEIGKIQPSLRMKVGGVNVGVTAVLDPAAFEALSDDGKGALLDVKEPSSVLPSVLADLEKDTNIQVLMVQGPQELAKRLATEFPGFDLVVMTSPFPDPPDKPEMVNDGKTWLVTAGKKGMYVGVLGLYLDPKQKFRYQRVELNKRYDKYRNEGDAAAIRKLIGDDFQETLKTVGVLQSYPRLPYALANVPAGATFVGAESCRDCHRKIYEHWESTKHSHAYEALVSDPRDAGRNREHDAACVSCHTVGFEFVGGFVTADQTPELKGVQCESCHGPGSAHADDSKDAAALAGVKRTAEDFRRNNRCIACHDEDNDPHFDWEKYWPQIIHNGLDAKAEK